MVLIANSGQGKTIWSVLYEGTKVLDFTTESYHLYSVSRSYLVDYINRNMDQEIRNLGFEIIYFYGLPVNKKEASTVTDAFRFVFAGAKVIVCPVLLD